MPIAPFEIYQILLMNGVNPSQKDTNSRGPHMPIDYAFENKDWDPIFYLMAVTPEYKAPESIKKQDYYETLRKLCKDGDIIWSTDTHTMFPPRLRQRIFFIFSCLMARKVPKPIALNIVKASVSLKKITK